MKSGAHTVSPWTYRVPLDPTDAQTAALASHAGVSRAAFNWALGAKVMAFSDATIIDNPRHLRAAKKRLTRAQRALSRSKWRLPSGDLIDVPKRGPVELRTRPLRPADLVGVDVVGSQPAATSASRWVCNDSYWCDVLTRA